MVRALPPSRFALRSDPVAVANPKMSVLFCHAAGFCAEVWRPVIDELSALARQPPGAPELVMSAIDLPGTTWLGRTLALALTLTLSLTLTLTLTLTLALPRASPAPDSNQARLPEQRFDCGFQP